MATFTSFQNILPDPNNRISYAGDSNASNAGSALGQGYASAVSYTHLTLPTNREV